ncbi:ribonuclease H-like domain-containing protein [Tanacetum coccineum]|uniref:Ribonuclease H-like domain-containing protein n=1 Tax=Tanacetum coccineum TaxID=301880 RepID=A0ABQ4ZFH3_9ASTR
MAEVLNSCLDAGNTLYLQSNDHSNMPIVGFKLTRFDNYKMWSTAMKIALKGKNKMRFIDELYLGQVYSKIDSEVWDELEETYDKIDGVLKHNQLVRLMQFLMGLNDVYQPVRSNFLARDPLPDVKDAFAIVSREESHKGLAPDKLSAKTPAAFFHMTVSTKNMFNAVDISSLKLTVSHPYGTMTKIAAIGSIKLTKHVVLFDVLVVYEYIDLKLVKIAGTGSEYGGLYMFDCENSGKSAAGMCNSGVVCYVSKELWHCRLGHPANQVLLVLSDKIGFKYGNHVCACDIYHKAKQTKEPFLLSDHKSNKLGDLVHLCNTPKIR